MNTFLLQHTLYLFFFLASPCGILVPHPGIEPVPPAEGVQSASHWTTREAPTANTLEFGEVKFSSPGGTSVFCHGGDFESVFILSHIH